MKTVAERLGTACVALRNCREDGNAEWESRWDRYITEIMDTAPHGSGIDGKNLIDAQNSDNTKIVIHTAFHHMDDVGMYDGWTDHSIIATPSFGGINVRVTGRNKRDIKEYLGDLFFDWFSSECKVEIPD